MIFPYLERRIAIVVQNIALTGLLAEIGLCLSFDARWHNHGSTEASSVVACFLQR